MNAKALGATKKSMVAIASILALAGVLPASSMFQIALAHTCEQNGCVEEGKMTGGGKVNTGSKMVLTHGFTLNCDDSKPNKLEINWDKGNRFQLQSVTAINCFDDPTKDSSNPVAAFDTLELSGFGKLNGQSGAFVWVQFTDFGEPGKNDWATIVVYDPDGNLILNITGNLKSGNHQAH